MKKLCARWVMLGIALAGAAGVARAEEGSPGPGIGPDWMAGAFGEIGQPSAFGGEVMLAGLFQPLAEHELLIGPKVGALLAWAENSRTRFDLNWGVSESMWFVNAVGSGLDLEVVAPSTITGEDSGVHYRIVPNLAIRALHFGEAGAWALRLGIPYDTHYKWGVQAGLTLQFNGIPRLGGLL